MGMLSARGGEHEGTDLEDVALAARDEPARGLLVPLLRAARRAPATRRHFRVRGVKQANTVNTPRKGSRIETSASASMLAAQRATKRMQRREPSWCCEVVSRQDPLGAPIKYGHSHRHQMAARWQPCRVHYSLHLSFPLYIFAGSPFHPCAALPGRARPKTRTSTPPHTVMRLFALFFAFLAVLATTVTACVSSWLFTYAHSSD